MIEVVAALGAELFEVADTTARIGDISGRPACSPRAGTGSPRTPTGPIAALYDGDFTTGPRRPLEIGQRDSAAASGLAQSPHPIEQRNSANYEGLSFRRHAVFAPIGWACQDLLYGHW